MNTYLHSNKLRYPLYTLFALLTCMAGTKPAAAQGPELKGVHEAMQQFVDAGDMSGAVTVVVTKDQVIHLDAVGLADIAKKQPMEPNTLFWVASMTKPFTAVAILMLQDEGKLNVTDPVAKYIPEFANLKTPSGKSANLTITQIMTHTSGLGEASDDAILKAKTLADLMPMYLAVPMQYEPGAKWKYAQSAINVAAHIIEVASGMSYEQFIETRILQPLGMTHSTFHPDRTPDVPRALGYAKNKTTGVLEPVPMIAVYSGAEGHPVLGNGGLFSTGPDYARFCQMLLGRGVFKGKRYLSENAMHLLTTIQTGDLPAGFLQGPALGDHGADYGWGIGVAIQRRPHSGVGAMLSAGTFGHGGAWGTQAWIDPVRGVAYILMVQRPGLNGDAAEVRRVFQQTASDAIGK